MASTSNPLETDEESKDVPLDQLFPALFGSSGSAAQEARSCLAYMESKRSFPSSSSSHRSQSSSGFSSIAPPSVQRQPKFRSASKGPHFCPDCGQGFKRMEDMHTHRKDCRARSEREKENTMLDAMRRNNSLHSMTKMEGTDDFHPDLNTLPSPKPEQSHDASEELGDRYSSQTPDSDGGSSTPETYIDDRKKQIIDSIVFSAMQWLHSKLDVWRKNAGGNSNSASGTSEALLDSHVLVGSSNPNNRGNKKRKVAEIDNHETDNEDEGGNWEDRQSSRMPIQGHEDPKFACPYFKYNPAKYKDWRTCPGPGWHDVHRVKEHLYRRHRQPQYRCARCWQPFADEQGIIDHQRTDEPCPLQEMGYVEGFDAVQERSLKSRKRANQKLSETEKWRRVFNILFPHVPEDDVPSPFYEYSQMPQYGDACQHPEAGYLAQCEQYMLREVPQRLRQALGRELDRDLTLVEENLRRRAGDWVKTLLEEAFQELRQIRHLGSLSQRPEASNDIPEPSARGQLPISELSSVEGASLHFEEDGETWLDSFDFESFDPSAILGELQSSFDNGGLIEGLLRMGEDGAGETTKQSDSGYVSNSPEQL